jgi:Tetracyclin repressor-like, C-terminal domain
VAGSTGMGRAASSIAAVLRGYGIAESEMNHAIRTLCSTMHGFAMLEASRGFQWDADPDESFDWMIGFIDRGLRPKGELACEPPAAQAAADQR